MNFDINPKGKKIEGIDKVVLGACLFLITPLTYIKIGGFLGIDLGIAIFVFAFLYTIVRKIYVKNGYLVFIGILILTAFIFYLINFLN